ncbi:hypothetical protein JZU71_00045, partial [bacterium]|nr:hypothetical protein [bacterium]
VLEAEKAKRVSLLQSQEANLPVAEHTPMSRRPNCVTKMANGLGRPLTDRERDNLVNEDRAAKRKESKVILKAYSDREISQKFTYTYSEKKEPSND